MGARHKPFTEGFPIPRVLAASHAQLPRQNARRSFDAQINKAARHRAGHEASGTLGKLAGCRPVLAHPFCPSPR